MLCIHGTLLHTIVTNNTISPSLVVDYGNLYLDEILCDYCLLLPCFAFMELCYILSSPTILLALHCCMPQSPDHLSLSLSLSFIDVHFMFALADLCPTNGSGPWCSAAFFLESSSFELQNSALHNSLSSAEKVSPQREFGLHSRTCKWMFPREMHEVLNTQNCKKFINDKHLTLLNMEASVE